MIPLREAGWDGDRTSIRAIRSEPERQAQAVLDADIVSFHRPNDDRCFKIAEMLRKQGKKIVFDNDDTYKGIDTMKMGKIFDKIDKAVDEFVKSADLVTCSTEFLAKEYRQLNPNVVVLPNCVDPEDWDEPLKNTTDKVRIGFVGSVGLNGDCDNFRPALEELAKRDDVTIVLFSLPPKDSSTMLKVQDMYRGDYAFWESLPNIEWHHFVKFENYITTLNELKLDIMVIPRRDDYFNRCKSNLKFLEASMLEVPVVAQGFSDNMSPYQVDPEDAQHMRIVVDNTKWMEELTPLIENPQLRHDMGKKAREYVVKKYSIENNIWKWKDAYSKLLQHD